MKRTLAVIAMGVLAALAPVGAAMAQSSSDDNSSNYTTNGGIDMSPADLTPPSYDFHNGEGNQQ